MNYHHAFILVLLFKQKHFGAKDWKYIHNKLVSFTDIFKHGCITCLTFSKLIDWNSYQSCLKRNFTLLVFLSYYVCCFFCFVYFISTLYIYIVSPYRTVKSKHTPYNKSLRKFLNVICVDYSIKKHRIISFRRKNQYKYKYKFL